VADATTACAILLVSDAHDGSSGCVEGVEWSSVGDDVVLRVIEDDVTCPELLGATPFPLSMACVLANAQQEVKSDCGHVATRL
jgi:hypothetical protein